PCFTLPG
uniref:Cryptide Pep-23 n=1 Tax=Tityus obscurus TaxID=1221240 RepID=CRY23_TITOB